VKPPRTAVDRAEQIARRDLTGRLNSVSGETGGPFEVLMQDKYNDGLRAGLIPLCPHTRLIDNLAWFPVEGCPAGCRECVGVWLVVNLTGTDEDTACDVCGRGPNAHGTYEERHLILGVSTPACPDRSVTIVYMVCRACQGREPELARAQRRAGRGR
jgi:hypothetical protein